jgi:hypothetical protein
MQQTFLEARYDTAKGTPIACLNAGYAVKVALVYQDALTRQWAGQVRDRIAEVAGPEALRCTEWQISNLKERNAFSESVRALAQADVIVVSVNEAERLPSVFYLWVNLWLQVRSKRPGLLIALVVPSEESNVAAMETRRYLCAVADQGGLEFLLQKRNEPGDPIRGLGENFRRWAKAA